jgi:hypothetical protein
MVKIHTKAKRAFGLGTHTKRKAFLKNMTRKHRPKTFATQEGANKWAAAQGMKEGEYTLVPAKKNKRFMVSKS